MGYYVPQMQQRYTGYDSGQNTARNLLDAVRMKNQAEMQRRQIASTEGMQQKQIGSTEKISKAQLENRYDISNLDRQSKEKIAENADKLARDLQSGRLDWQSLDREDQQSFNKLAQQRGFDNAESMLKSQLDAQATRQDKDLQFKRDDLAFRTEIGRGQLGLGRDRLGLDRELGMGRLGLGRDRLSLDTELGRGQLNLGKDRFGLDRTLGTGRLALDTARLAQDESQFGRSLEERVRQFDLGLGEDQRQFNIGDQYRSAAEKRIAGDHAMRMGTARAQSALSKDKLREVEEAEAIQEEINTQMENTNLLQGVYDALPFTRSTEKRVYDQVYERAGEPFKAYPTSYYYDQEPNAMLNPNSLMDLQNNPLLMSNQRALGTQYLQQPPIF